MLDRTQAPVFSPIGAISLPDIVTDEFQNNIPLYSAGFAKQDVIKLEFVFNAGSAYETKKGVAALLTKMLLGGTKNKTGAQIMEGFDQYGGFVEISSRIKRLQITLYGLKKHLGKYLDLIKEILEESVFPLEELEAQRKIALQNLRLNLEKSSFLASREFKSTLFGEAHPYGKSLEEQDLIDVKREEIESFYLKNIKGKGFKIFAAGNIGKQETNSIKSRFGVTKYEFKEEIEISFPNSEPSKKLIEKKDKMQTTIRMGKPLFDRNHPDFFKMMVTNTAFGGYFGSRLMRNIREEKGFTYGISSSMNPLKNFGYLMIGSDVVKENTLETLSEIEKEINILKNELMEEEELITIQNYMCGSFAGSVTTAFEVMEKQKNLILSELPKSYYNSFVDKIKSVSREEVMIMAQKHLDFEGMTEVLVGERI